MDNESNKEYVTKENVELISLLTINTELMKKQSALIEKQYDLINDTIKKDKKRNSNIILVFTIAIVLISLGYMFCQTIAENNRNNVKIENTSTSYSESGIYNVNGNGGVDSGR